MRRYELLDCLRGEAAVAVVLYHLSVVRLEYHLMPQGYLAVDFFFALSGFVLANAYHSVLSLDRRTISWFLRKRIVRLYPLAFAGVVFGLALLVCKWIFFPQKTDSSAQVWLSAAFNILLLPTFWGGAPSRHLLFPGNGALWSLFFEFIINVVWAFVLVKRTVKELCFLVFASAVFLIWQTYATGTENLGNESATFLGGLARVSFGFTAGVLIYRLRGRIQAPEIAGANWILMACLGGLLAFPASGFFPQQAYDLICAIGIMPMIVLGAASQNGLGRVGQLAGELSYPLYVLHYPVLLIASGLYQTKLSGVEPHMLSIGAVTTAVVISWLALTLYDQPSRDFLSRLIDRIPGNAPVPQSIWRELPPKLMRIIGR
jgi:peptidoglycan/LPS O-acetylase OafA/YrhL